MLDPDRAHEVCDPCGWCKGHGIVKQRYRDAFASAATAVAIYAQADITTRRGPGYQFSQFVDPHTRRVADALTVVVTRTGWNAHPAFTDPDGVVHHHGPPVILPPAYTAELVGRTTR